VNAINTIASTGPDLMTAILAKIDNINGRLENGVFPGLNGRMDWMERVLESVERKWDESLDAKIKEIEVSHITIQD
jgi:hypothetical protein